MPDVIFNGPEGRLEGRYQHAKTDDAPVALIFTPTSATWRYNEQQSCFIRFIIISPKAWASRRFGSISVA